MVIPVIHISKQRNLRHFMTIMYLLEAWAGIEPAYNGFANRCLTTWLPRLYIKPILLNSYYTACFRLRPTSFQPVTTVPVLKTGTDTTRILQCVFLCIFSHIKRDTIDMLSVLFSKIYFEVNKWYSPQSHMRF